MRDYYDVIIVGAGPAGCTCAYQLSGKGLKIAIIEKDRFPRDKVCGDAIGPDVVNQLFRMNKELIHKFKGLEEKMPSAGIRFYAPDHKHFDLFFRKSPHTERAGHIIKRTVFDNFLFDQIKELPDVDVYQENKLKKVDIDNGLVTVVTNEKSLKGKLIVGADGANSVVKNALTKNKIDRKHHCAGLRQYYENVTGFDEHQHIELHFYKDIVPGYFWIFPLPNNQANVGMGMLSNELSHQKINLKEKFAEIIEKHPNIKDRFKDAKALETVKGFGLPMGSTKRSCSGDHFLLLGDAAGLIDPFSGEGIGNALRSARIAADHISKAFEADSFDATFNKKYDNEVYAKMWNEFRLSRFLQHLLNYPRFFNFLLTLGRKSKFTRKLLNDIMEYKSLKKLLSRIVPIGNK